jgi:hypothetical protein
MKTLFTIFLSFLLFTSYAQEKKTIYDNFKGNSIGLITSGNGYSVGYKINKQNGKSILVTGTSTNFAFSQPNNYNLAVGINLHFLKNYFFNDKFFLAHGWGIGAGLNAGYNGAFNGLAITTTLRYRVEFNYNISNNFSLGVALNPGLRISTNVNDNFEASYNINLGASQAGQIQCFYTI